MIDSIIATLNTIEVHGKDNLDKLLGCIMALEIIQKETSKMDNDNKEDAVDGK